MWKLSLATTAGCTVGLLYATHTDWLIRAVGHGSGWVALWMEGWVVACAHLFPTGTGGGDDTRSRVAYQKLTVLQVLY